MVSFFLVLKPLYVHADIESPQKLTAMLYPYVSLKRDFWRDDMPQSFLALQEEKRECTAFHV